MKKTLLFTIAFLGAITFASAQTTATYDTAGVATQSTTVGTSGVISDSNIVTITGGSASPGTNANFFSILAVDPNRNTATGTFTFNIASNSSTDKNLYYQFEVTKRAGNTAAGTINIDGVSTSFSLPSTGSTTQGTETLFLTFPSVVAVSSSPKVVVITISSLTDGTVTTTHNATFRLNSVKASTDNTLSTNNFDLKSFRVFPNPTADSFQISTEESITSIALLNVTGQLVKTFAPSENYDISDLNAGIYFATVSSENGSQTIKIVKK